MLFGLPRFGNWPGAWSGKPLAWITRWPPMTVMETRLVPMWVVVRLRVGSGCAEATKLQAPSSKHQRIINFQPPTAEARLRADGTVCVVTRADLGLEIWVFIDA